MILLFVLLIPAFAQAQMYLFDEVNVALYMDEESVGYAQTGKILMTQESVGQNGMDLIFYYLEDIEKLEDVTFAIQQEITDYIKEIGVPIFGVVRQERGGEDIPEGLRGMDMELFHEDESNDYRVYRMPKDDMEPYGEDGMAVIGTFLANYENPEEAIVVLTESDTAFGDFSAMDIDFLDVHTPEIFAERKLTMVNIWGTFCGPCIVEMPYLAEISAEYADKCFQIVGIVSDVPSGAQQTDGTVELAQEIIKETGVTYLNLIPDQAMVFSYLKNSQYIPETVFVDSQGQMVGEAVIGSNDKEEWIAIIEERLAMIGE